MPWYRMNGMTVHVRGSKKLPPGCGAAVGIGERSIQCLAPSCFQCDWELGHGRTCDRHLCAAHAVQIDTDKHYCPAHNLRHIERQPQAGLFTDLLEADR